jgi:hypothetical protein
MPWRWRWLPVWLLVGWAQAAGAQQRKDTLTRPVPVDSLAKIAQPVRDKKADSALHAFSPRKAIIRSAIIPGWGQIYNKKYWKLPIVYGAIGTAAFVFFTNLTTYRDLRFAYRVKYILDTTNSTPRDSTDYFKIKPEYRLIQLQSLRYNRDNFRRYVDYSVLFFVALWGLNIVDAAVDAHLKSFDVSPDLSLRLKTGYSEMARTNGIGLVLTFK